MDCRQCQEELTAYLDDELPPSTAANVRFHVEQCKPCAAELRGLEESAAFLESNLRAVELRKEVWGHVRARIAVEAPQARPAWIRLFLGNRWLAATATLAAAAVLALGIWSYRQHELEQLGLEQYMTDYLQHRELREQRRTKAPEILVPPDVPDDMANPFVTVRATMTDNPFRQEAQ